MKTQNKEKKPASSGKKRGLNSDEQKRRTNRPVPEYPDGTATVQKAEKDVPKIKDHNN